jgi:hypothetical protein
MSRPPLLDPKRRSQQRWIRRLVLWALLVALSFYVFLNTQHTVRNTGEPAGVESRM